MRDTRKESSKSSLSRLEYGSLLIASLKFNRKDRTLSRCKTHILKSESPLKAVGAKMMKRKVSNTSSKGMRKCSTSRKAISRKIVRKALDKKTPKKLPSSGPRGKYSSVTVKRRKKKGKRGNKEKVELDEPARLQRRTRYLLIKMKHEQNYIDAYSGEGWKGQSREKIKPEKELLRAQKEILKCKLGIRDIICQLDSSSKVGCIEDSVIAPDGSVSHEHIFCAKCKSNDVNPDNDIILCDGTCNCGFHQKCLDPPLDTENIPPGDQGWYCDFCECRMEIIEAVNAHLGTHFSVSCCWQEIFKEAAVPDGGHILLNPEEEWPSDDSEDGDYDPEGRENSISGAGTGDDASGDASSSTSLGWSSDGEVFSGSRKWQMNNTDLTNQSIYSSLGSVESSDGEIMNGRRQRRAVDYRKLYDEMFGKDGTAHEQFSEDEDWGPGKRKRRVKESDAASTLMTLYESEKKSKKVETIEVKRRLSRDTQVRRSFFRIPPYAVEKLRQVFAENELPSRTVKEKLSRELDLEPGKVSKWFKNARYMALKLRKEDGSKELDNSSPLICTSSRLEGMKSTTGVLVEIKPTSLENRIHSPKDLKQLRRKKNLNSIRRSSKENELKKMSLESPSGSDKINVEDNDDVSLKKLLKSKPSRGKKMLNSISTTEYKTAEAEMERLCRVKDRLENMKSKLIGVQTHKAKKPNRNHLRNEESVVFVPIAELKEKLC